MKLRTFGLTALGAVLMTTTILHAETELRITHSITSGASREALDEIIAGFQAQNPEITVKQIVFDDDLYSDTGLITQLQSSEVPDIYFQWAGFPVKRDAAAGYAADLSEALATGAWRDSFVDSVWSDGGGAQVDGKPYLVPTSLDVTNTIWYNKSIFEENGLTEPQTWDEFVALIKVLADAGEIPIIEGNNELWPLGNWASHIASRVVPVDEYQAAFSQEGPFNTPDFLKALQLLAELHDIGAFNRDMPGLGADPAMATFFQEAAAMHPIGSWLIGSESDLADEGFSYGQFDTPLIDDTHPLKDSVIGTATGFIVHDKSPHKPEAIAFLQYFTSPENQKLWAEHGNLSPVKGVMETAELDEHTKSVAALLSNAGSIVPPPDTTYPVPVAEAFYQAAAYAASGEKTPQDALTWLDETVAIIGKQ